uniref:Fatty acyl-CoA reductase n=1 Tax=Graphocephala atropunctata TaxID=36148 RepID=A0A1B6MEP8_9HEMI
MFPPQVFLRMKTEVPDYRSKITVMEGDLSEPDIGLSEADRQVLTERVNVVFHSAADVKFIEPLRVAVESNVFGSKRILELAKGMKALKSYVHVSTAYSFCVQRVIAEEVPKMSISLKDILHDLENKNDEEIEENIERILQGWPNTYAFTKALCEDMIQDEYQELPICIYRPSVVGPSSMEPVRGWTDNVYGPFGVLVGIEMGILHCFRTNKEYTLDIVPVDLVVNGMIAAAWRTGTSRASKLPVYNFTLTPEQRADWKSMHAYGDLYAGDFAFSQAVWYNSFFFTSSSHVDNFCHLFLHKIPGLILDRLAVMSGKKPRLMNIYKNIDAVKLQMHYFLFGIWEFKNDNVKELRNIISKEDKALFHFDVREVVIEEFFLTGKLGFRYYYMKDGMETIPDAKRKNKWLYWTHNTFKLVSGLVVLKLLVLTAHVLPI